MLKDALKGLRLGWFLTAGAIATAAVHLAGVKSWGLSALAAFVGWPVAGTLVTLDDDLPGGWSNPDGTRTPDWRTAGFWGQLSLGVGISALLGAIEQDIATGVGLGLLTLGLVTLIGGILLVRRQLRRDASP